MSCQSIAWNGQGRRNWLTLNRLRIIGSRGYVSFESETIAFREITGPSRRSWPGRYLPKLHSKRAELPIGLAKLQLSLREFEHENSENREKLQGKSQN